MEEDVKTKRCPKCERVLPLSSFSHDKSRKDGLDYWCKDCKKLKLREWRAKHPTYYVHYQQENKNKEKKAAYNAIYYDPQKNPLGWAKSMVRGYRKMDRDRFGDDSQTITAEWFLDNIAYQPCSHCGLTRFGSIGVNRKSNALGHIPSNCEPCCSSCNSRQNCKDMLERGLYWFQKGKKQSFNEFVKEQKAKNKNLS